ncbi:polysaccharide deacetylase family protein [Haladaptatus sp. DFWS20]|uniref:polysaccharide deacetylase family protein n=1 Tax=Haladaptatus sp. DFWS20 TaxID=3403467 RepID=UPI003EBCE93C
MVQKSGSGKLVFIYDDGTTTDYTKIFPVHQGECVPGCFAVVSGLIGSEGRLTISQLLEINAAGNEIISHTIKHRALGSLEVTKDVEKDDTKVYGHSNRYGEIPGDDIRIFDSEKHETVTVTGNGTDETGEFITLESPVTKAFSADDARIRYTDEILKSAVGGSKAQLEGYGVNVSNFVLPYGINSDRGQELVPKHYSAVANAERGDGLNPIRGLDPYNLHRRYFRPDRMSKTELETHLDRVANNDVLAILVGHSAYENFSAERVRTAIRLAKERNIEIVTLRKALVDLGFAKPTTTTTQR